MESRIKEKMAQESGLSMDDITSTWEHLRLTMWYLRLKNELELEDARVELAKSIGLLIISNRFVKYIINLLNKI